VAIDFCSGCKAYKDIVFVEEGTDRNFCGGCTRILPPAPEELALAFVLATIPFKPGDRVECRTGAQLYDGIGTVQEISMLLENGGTPVFPSFRVAMEEKAIQDPEVPDELWYTEVCLTKVAS